MTGEVAGFMSPMPVVEASHRGPCPSSTAESIDYPAPPACPLTHVYTVSGPGPSPRPKMEQSHRRAALEALLHNFVHWYADPTPWTHVYTVSWPKSVMERSTSFSGSVTCVGVCGESR